ncbi:hypothetical protein FS842_010977 [Serendipita sp. 407]|nr:hypothetical protein FS842_010977 [Serendipita sp. 407]
MSEAQDTDILIALLSSLLDIPITPTQDVLLSALADADGDVEKAAEFLNSSKSNSRPNPVGKKKRKRGGNLNSWIVSKKKAPGSHEIDEKEDHSERGSNSKKANGNTEVSSLSVWISSEDEEEDERGVLGGPSVASEVEGRAGYSSAEKGMEKKEEKTEKAPLLMALKPPPASPKRPPKLLPRTLATPALVSQYTPCTMHTSILPPELACQLFYAMLKEATDWSRNKWWLFDRVVESPHKTSFYARNLERDLEQEDDMREAAKYWYNGRPTAPPRTFLPEMEAACEIIERIVNDEIRKRGTLYPLEWPSTEEHPWQANVAAANCYTGSKETVGFHSDQLTYLGPCPTIASLSLGTSRIFRLREVIPQSERDERNAQTFNIPVVHNSLLIMHASCQERFKHCVPPQQTIDAFKPLYPPPLYLTKQEDEEEQAKMMPHEISRINITFRFYRPDFAPKSIPRCHCGVPTILRPDMKRLRRKEERSMGDRCDDSKSIRETTTHSFGTSNWDEIATMQYFWMCYAGAQNDGKGCSFFQVLDYEKEGRGTQNI